MKQQAIDILKDEIKVQEEMGNNYFISVLKFLIEKMETLGDGWIPVTERLPEEGCYLVFADDIMYVTATGNDGIFWSAGEIVLGVTHWMPLPLPPN